jgi:tRNA (guanine10-N2)-dimethyltransferase
MEYLFELSMENPEISAEEILRLLDTKKDLEDNKVLLADIKQGNLKHINRLSYTHAAFQLLFSSEKEKLAETIKNYPWLNLYKKDFCVRVHDISSLEEGSSNFGAEALEKELAGLVWHRLKDPKVRLSGSETELHFFFGKKIYCGKLLWENQKELLKRKAHLRPALHPSSMHPKLARAAVNLSGIRKGTLLDPFCGSGGILIEAGLMGLSIKGHDIDGKMIEMAKTNLQHYGIKKFSLKKLDATKLSGKYAAIVTDLPYGRNTKLDDMAKTYTLFFRQAFSCTDCAVVMLPASLSSSKINSFIGRWKLHKSFTYYLHKSLSKKILVLGK